MASNAAGITVTNIITNYIDITAPVLTITNPLTSTIQAGMLTFMGQNAESFSTIDNFSYQINSGAWTAALNTNTETDGRQD